MCANRFTGTINKAMFYPDGYKDTFDVTFIDFEEFFMFNNIIDAVNWLEQENAA